MPVIAHTPTVDNRPSPGMPLVPYTRPSSEFKHSAERAVLEFKYAEKPQKAQRKSAFGFKHIFYACAFICFFALFYHPKTHPIMVDTAIVIAKIVINATELVVRVVLMAGGEILDVLTAK